MKCPGRPFNNSCIEIFINVKLSFYGHRSQSISRNSEFAAVINQRFTWDVCSKTVSIDLIKLLIGVIRLIGIIRSFVELRYIFHGAIYLINFESICHGILYLNAWIYLAPVITHQDISKIQLLQDINCCCSILSYK